MIQQLWDKAWTEYADGIDLTKARVGGRANGNLVVVDLKTSQQTPSSSLQLGFYKFGLNKVLGADVNLGTYWMARQSGTVPLIDLSTYTDDKIEYLVEKFDFARKSAIFLPNTNNCNRCSLTEHCQFTSKKEKK